MWESLPLFPAQASTMAQKVDALYLFLVAITAFFTVLIFLMILVFAIKYRRSRNPHATQIEGNNTLEITWSVIPLGIALLIFVWSTAVYFSYASVPSNAIQVYGIGKQWMWKFQHADGQREINQLHVPVGRDVAVTLISQDVIHSFFVPAFRVKMDVLPGRYRTTWFKAIKTGSYHLFCAEYCGTMHSGMIGEVVVMEPADYERWLTQNGEGSMASSGEKLFRHFGCISCHRADSGQRGPDLSGLYGKKVFLSDGRSLIADENYIRESIVEPKAKIVAGFQPIMPTFQGQATEDEMLQLVSYIKSLKQMPTNVNPDADIPSPEMRRRNPNVQPQPGEPLKGPKQ